MAAVVAKSTASKKAPTKPERLPPVGVAPKDGILCLEGAWGEGFESRETIEPALRCLESFGLASIAHRDVATREELQYYIDRWLDPEDKAAAKYTMGMFAFHGAEGEIALGKELISLRELGKMIGRRAQRKVIYIGGCEVLGVEENELIDFCRVTGARGLVGYTKAVEFIETIAFEVMLIRTTFGRVQFKPIYDNLTKEHPYWTKRLGLRMATRSWASPRWRRSSARSMGR
ncbi:DUF6642 family protein [Aestuariimicrobium sp. Y1814]|uniref:DUF6642 family protein n=1 Tax=Aestuariimicrobium sp. Y1814 TaxID=3418742 RepID=UPI003DA79218